MAHRSIQAPDREKKITFEENKWFNMGNKLCRSLRSRTRRTLMIKPSAMAANWNLRHHVCVVRVVQSNLAKLSFVWSREPLDDIKRSFGAENVFLFSQQQTRRRRIKAKSRIIGWLIVNRSEEEKGPSIGSVLFYRRKSFCKQWKLDDLTRQLASADDKRLSRARKEQRWTIANDKTGMETLLTA